MAPDVSGNDPLLAGFVAAASVGARDEETADLIATHAVPVVSAILRRRLARLGVHDAELLADLEGDVIVRLLHRLRRLVEEPQEPISSFVGYAAVVAYHRFDDFVRATRPARAALANRVRYALRHSAELSVWEDAGGDLCAGFARWHGLPAGPHRRADPVVELDVARLRRLPLHDLLVQIFARLRRPVELSALVALVADLLELREPTAESAELPRLVGRSRHPLEQLEQLEHLHRLWREIRELPLRQRWALLLNLRDPHGDSMTRLLPITGVAGLAEIASTLELTPGQLAELWRELPVEDLRIADRLGLTRQQVINLRKSARERLTRRLARVG